MSIPTILGKLRGYMLTRELLSIVLVAALLRFWKIAAKPLWGDELYTAFYSLGKSLEEIPINQLLPLSDYWNLLAYSPDSSAFQAAYAVTTYSNHPPLFFMVMNGWLRWCGSSVWHLRALPALFGILSVIGGYTLGRTVGGAKAGRYTALLMAVSPYSIYLSQEARHYSLAVAIATFSLTLWLSLLNESTPNSNKTSRRHRWIVWALLNGLGLWIHYFYGFCIAAQWILTSVRLWQKQSAASHRTVPYQWLLAMSLTLLLCAPLWPTLLAHFQSQGGVGWLSRTLPLWQTVVLPLVQSLAAAVFMLILLPVEEMPLAITIVSAVVMWCVFWLVLQQGIVGWHAAPHQRRGQPLVGYVMCVFAIILVITYSTRSDLTVAPRYFFALYPAVTAVMACGLSRRRPWLLWAAIAAGVLSQVFIIHNLALFKPFLPEKIGPQLAANDQPTIVLFSPTPPSYSSRTLSYVLAIPPRPNILVGFIDPVPDSDWQLRLPETNTLFVNSFTLWLVEVYRQAPFPESILLPSNICTISGEALVTKGTRQQQYECD